MNATRGAGTLLALALVLAVPRAARSQPAETVDATAAEARRRFQAGVALFQEGNPQGALLEFEESMRLRPVAVVQFNIAQALKLLLRYEEAIAAYDRYLAMGGAEITPERREDVEVTIARLRRSVAHVDVSCGPSGAEVLVDGRAVGHLPLERPLSVAAGHHEIELRAPGRGTATRALEVVGGATAQVCLTLPPAEVVGRGGAAHASSGVLGRWWFWALTGAVVAGGVTAAVLLSAPEEGGLYRGNVNPDLVTAAW